MDVFKNIVQPALQRNGYEATWCTEPGNKPERIAKELWKSLVAAPLVIADLTDHNPNVLYELAVRHAAGKPAILIAQAGTEDIFDVREVNTIPYDLKDANAVRACIESIQTQVGHCEENSYYRDVHEAITTQALIESEKKLEGGVGRLLRTMDEFKGVLSAVEQRVPTAEIVESYRGEIAVLKALRGSGIISPYPNRASALREFLAAIDAESSEITIAGSSLLGLLQKEPYREVARRLEQKAKQNTKVKVLLTHPKVADLRAEQEGRKQEAIGAEIVKSLSILRQWDVPPEVRLYLGTPTIFAIKTERKMLLNFYAYKAFAYESPCLIVTRNADRDMPFAHAYFYDDYDRAHFGAWDSSATEIVSDYESAQRDGRLDPSALKAQFEEKIKQLQDDLPQYSRRIVEMLKGTS
jgi:hypothetical protein